MGLIEPDAADRLIEKIDQEELVDLGKSLIRVPSFIGEETPLPRWVASYLSARGYDVELQEVERGWFPVVATVKGSGNGHMSHALSRYQGLLTVEVKSDLQSCTFERYIDFLGGRALRSRDRRHFFKTGTW